MPIVSTSTSSSSAISMGSDVNVPCPISMCGDTKMTLPVRSMRRNAFGANGALVVSPSRTSERVGMPKPSNRPPPTATVALILRKLRREDETESSASIKSWFMSHLRRCFVAKRARCSGGGRSFDARADAWIGAAAADVPRHRIVDVRIARVGLCYEQCGGRHDLAGLAVTALRHIQCEPGRLNPLACSRVSDGFDGG